MAVIFELDPEVHQIADDYENCRFAGTPNAEHRIAVLLGQLDQLVQKLKDERLRGDWLKARNEALEKWGREIMPPPKPDCSWCGGANEATPCACNGWPEPPPPPPDVVI